MDLLLRTEELLRHIYQYLEPSDLARLSRVHKQLGSVALDILWNTVDLVSLLYLFPSDIVGLKRPGSKCEFVKAPRRSDWERFSIYSPRIRTIRRTPTLDLEFVNYGNILFFIRQHHQGAPLPNLQHLEWRGASAHELPGLSVFFVPSLQTVHLSEVHASGPGNLSGLSHFNAVEAPLRVLADLELSLWAISMPIPYGPLNGQYLEACTSLLTNSLVAVDIAESAQLLRVLGGLRKLQFLTVRLGRREYIGSGDSDADEGQPVGQDAFSLGKEDQDARERFPVLWALTVLNATSLRDVTSLISSARCFPSHEITIVCKRIPSASKISQFLEDGMHPNYKDNLTNFSITATLAEDDEVWEEEISDDLPMGWHGDPWNAPGARITMDHLKSLLSCRGMQVFTLVIGYPVVLSDSELGDLVSAWPNIMVLRLGTCNHIGISRPEYGVTLRGLASLSACPKLLTVEVYLDILAQDTRDLPTEHPVCPLRWLIVGDSDISGDFSVAMACFLVHRFPKLNQINWCARNETGQRWREVESGLESVRLYRQYDQTQRWDAARN